MKLLLPAFQDQIKEIVKGQEDVVNRFATVIFKYMLKIAGKDFGCYFKTPSVVLCCGHSGSGKTHLVRTVAELINKDLSSFQFIELNAKSITQEGWAGTSLLRALQKEMKSNQGIIFIDEFDKLLEKNICSGGDDVNFHVQTTLLKYIEGYTPEDLPYDLSNFIFVLAGAFNAVYEIENKKASIGFQEEVKSKHPAPDKFIQAGLIPEIAGRIQEYLIFEELNEESLGEILSSDDFIYKKYQTIFRNIGYNLVLDENAAIEEAIKIKLGARSLIQIIEKEVSKFMDENKEGMDLMKVSPLYSGRR